LRTYPFVPAVVLLAFLFAGGGAAALGAPSPQPAQGRLQQAPGSTLAVDRTVERPPVARSHLWVGAVVGVFGVVGLALSRSFGPAGGDRRTERRPAP